ncbi:MAG: hypothetical protein ACLFR1_10505 [Spirochaetia bacterium]
MKVAVIYFPARKREKLLSVTKALAAGIEAQGAEVDIIDGLRDVNTKLTMYKYIAVGTEPLSIIGGKLLKEIQPFLGSSGMVAGKRSFAFILKAGLSSTKTLQNLMKVMESEGMYLKYSEIFSNPEEAEEIGKQLHLK